MYSGDPVTVKFLCDETAFDHMIDTFGKDITIQKQEDGKYIIYAKTSCTGAKLLAQQYMQHIQILEPESLRAEFTKTLKAALESYE